MDQRETKIHTVEHLSVGVGTQGCSPTTISSCVMFDPMMFFFVRKHVSSIAATAPQDYSIAHKNFTTRRAAPSSTLGRNCSPSRFYCTVRSNLLQRSLGHVPLVLDQPTAKVLLRSRLKGLLESPGLRT